MLSTAEKYVSKGLKVLATSAKIPQFPICVSREVSETDRTRLTEALIGLKDKRILQSLGAKITGFGQIKDGDYDGVREMLRKLGG